MQRTTIRRIIRFTILGTLLLGQSSCINDYYDDVAEYAAGNGGTSATVGVSLTIQARAMSSIQSDSEEYVEGTQWENYINMYAGDYRIYFFTYDPSTETEGSGDNSTLIAEFAPSDIYSTDAGVYTTYTLSGEIGADVMADYTSFKVLVAANWGADNYPTNLTAGETTIDDICNAGMFNAFVDIDNEASPATSTAAIPSYSNNHIPLFGLSEYTGVEWTLGRMTRLSGDITMLRAVAKVEVIVSDESIVQNFEDVSIVNYNAQGYCAPTGVYLKGDYNHDSWEDGFVDALHLVNKDTEGNGINDTDQEGHTFTLQKTTNADGQETWVGYLTEYDNMGEDYSYISVMIDGVSYEVYFGNYTNGSTTAYGDSEDDDMSDRFDIYRNYLYRFYVTKTAGEAGVTVSVSVHEWETLDGEDFSL